MATTQKTLKELFIEDLTGSPHREVAERLLDILSFPYDDAGLAEALEHLSPVLECLQSILPGSKINWESWHDALPALIQIAGKFEAEIAANAPKRSRPLSKSALRNRWYRKFKYLPILSLIIEKPDPEQLANVLPAKSVLFAARALDIQDGWFIKNCSAVRKSHLKADDSACISCFPKWDHNREEWEKNLKFRREQLPGKGIGKYRNLFAVPKALIRLYDSLCKIQNPTAYIDFGQTDINETLFDDYEEPSISTTLRRSGQSFHDTFRQRNTIDAEHTADAPRQMRAFQMADAAAEQATPSLPSQRQQARYTNYHTRLQKQFLPYAWDVLNPLEIDVLLNGISRVAGDHAISASLMWLMLFTGLSLADLLAFQLARTLGNEADIDTEGNWRRVILSPDNAYAPDDKQEKIMERHAESILLKLPMPQPDLLQRILSTATDDESTMQRFLSDEALGTANAESKARKFLAGIRNASEGRITLGRVQNTLAAYVMCVTGDPVIVHLLAGRKKDMPPVGAYYAAFDTEWIQHVYQEAVTRMINP